jgi:hypothetical protein
VIRDREKYLTQEILKELIHYNPDTGIFTWKERDIKWFKSVRSYKIWNGCYPNEVAGNILYGKDNNDYWRISVLNKRYLSHRLVFLYMTGRFPEHVVDHINHDGLNNQWLNLREVTDSGNSKNQKLRINNKSGSCGTYFNKISGKWVSEISDGNKKFHLGCFDKLEDAILARKVAEKSYGYHENHGK